jgi:hypothetical protein
MRIKEESNVPDSDAIWTVRCEIMRQAVGVDIAQRGGDEVIHRYFSTFQLLPQS